MTIRSAEVVQCMLIGNVLDLTPAAGNPIDRHFYTVVPGSSPSSAEAALTEAISRMSYPRPLSLTSGEAASARWRRSRHPRRPGASCPVRSTYSL